jgi:hypothetical protein
MTMQPKKSGMKITTMINEKGKDVIKITPPKDLKIEFDIADPVKSEKLQKQYDDFMGWLKEQTLKSLNLTPINVKKLNAIKRLCLLCKRLFRILIGLFVHKRHRENRIGLSIGSHTLKKAIKK